MHEIGYLWLSEVITAAHEHFISSLIKQKLLVNIERAQSLPVSSDTTFVLYLPSNELHDLGLLYIHLELLLKGHRSIFLGPSVPIDSLLDLQKIYSKITFISYFTVEPQKDEVMDYLKEMESTILSGTNNTLHLLGNNAPDQKLINKENPAIHAYTNIVDLIENM